MSWFIRYSYHQLIFSVCSFQGTLLTDFSSVIRNLNIFRPLITGETSFHSTALLIGLARRIVVRPCLYLFLTSAAVLPLFFFFLNWRPPTLPHRLQCSTIGRSGLNHRVRDGNGCCPWTHRHQKAWVLGEVFSSLRTKLCSSASARSFRAVSPKNFLLPHLITQQ